MQRFQNKRVALSASEFLASKAKGGTIHPMIHASHLMEITQERTRELQSTYKLFTTEGDM